MTEYELWMVFGTWFAGIATMCAAGISLWIALGAERNQFEVTLRRNGRYLGVLVVNKGRKVEVIDSIGFYCNDSYVGMRTCESTILQPGNSWSEDYFVEIKDLQRTIQEKCLDLSKSPYYTILKKIIKNEDVLMRLFLRPLVFKVAVFTNVRCVSKKWIQLIQFQKMVENGGYSENFAVRRKYIGGKVFALYDFWIIVVVFSIIGLTNQLTDVGFIINFIMIVAILIITLSGIKNGIISYTMMLINAFAAVLCMNVFLITMPIHIVFLLIINSILLITLFDIFVKVANN